MNSRKSLLLAAGSSLGLHLLLVGLFFMPGGGGGGTARRSSGEFALSRAVIIKAPPPKVVEEIKPRNEAAVIEEKATPVPSPSSSPEPSPEPEALQEQAVDEGDGGTEGLGPGSGGGIGFAQAPKEYLPFYKVDVKPEYIKKADLRYPEQGRRNGKEATVVVEADIEETGRIAATRIVSPPAGFGFDEAAQAYVRACRFSPAKAQGRPVPVRMRITISFTLR